MKNDFVKIVMNPTRIRIIQYLAIHNTGTVGEMRKALNDIPPASIYRHIKTLFDAKFIEVTEEKQIRGTVEKTYSLSKFNGDINDNNSTGAIFRNALLSLLISFDKYFDNPENNPQKDMLSLGTSVLMMSDEEYLDFLKKIAVNINEVIGNEVNPDRRPRRFTVISSPCEDKLNETEK